MFVEIKWKNSKGDEKIALVPSDKVQSFVNKFLERNVVPVLVLPNSDITPETLTLKQT